MKFTDTNIIKPKALKKGDAIGITAPSSQIKIKSISNFATYLTKLGYKVVLGDTITTVHDKDYNSGTAKQRADDLNQMIQDNSIKAIFAGAGGFGAQRTSYYVDFESLKKNPKPIIGFSDTTFLLNAITKATGIVSFLGPTAEIVDFEKDKLSIELCLRILSDEIEYPSPYTNLDGSIIRKISNSNKSNIGQLIGGNLTMIQTTLGTDFEVDTDGKILLIEEVSESSYSIERALDHLISAGKFDNLAGLVFGEFVNIATEPVQGQQDGNPSIHEILVKKFGNKEYPVLTGYNFSHGGFNLTLPIGSIAKIDGRNRQLSLVDKPVK